MIQLTLQVFSCVENPVKYVHPAAFRGLLMLKSLKLRHTQLHQLPSLQDIRHSLTYLEVSNSNVKETYAQTFTYLKIKHLQMRYNVLSITPLGLYLIASTIITLDFEFNSISALTSMEGVEFIKLVRLGLKYNNITHLRPEFLITPRLESLNLVGNHLVSLSEVTQYSWGSSLPEHTYMAIHLEKNSWHCDGSLIWMSINLYKIDHEIIYAKPPFKPYIKYVERLLCESPDARRGTTVVPMDVIESVNISIRSVHDLAGMCYCHFALNTSFTKSNYS